MAIKKIMSERFHMEAADWKVFGEEALTKLSPYLIVIIPVMIEQLPKEVAYGAILVFLLQRAKTFLSLWLTKHEVAK